MSQNGVLQNEQGVPWHRTKQGQTVDQWPQSVYLSPPPFATVKPPAQ